MAPRLIVLLLLPAKVGKTSLIMSLVGEEFPEQVSLSDSAPLLFLRDLGCCLADDLPSFPLGFVQQREKVW